MSVIEKSWTLVNDALEDADSVSSIYSADDSSDQLRSASVTASSTPFIQESAVENCATCEDTGDISQLQRRIRILSIENSRLKRLVRRDSDEPASLNEVIECFMEWFVSTFGDGRQSGEPSEISLSIESLEMVTAAVHFHCVDQRGGIAADFEKIASIPLRAGGLVGSLFRPDYATMEASRRFRERNLWIKAL